MRDLFQSDDGGWLQDAGLLDRLVAEKLERDAEAIRAEGWKWVEVATDFPYGHTYGLRQHRGRAPAADRGGGRDASTPCGPRPSGSRRPSGGGRSPRGGRSAARRDRDGDRRVRRAPGQLSTPPRSPAPAPLSASTARAVCVSSAAMSVPRMKRRSSSRNRRSRRRRAGWPLRRRPLAAASRPPSRMATARFNPSPPRGGGRRPAASARPIADRTDRLSHAGAREAIGNASRRRLSRGAACSLPEAVLPLRLQLLPGDRGEERRPSAPRRRGLATRALAARSTRAIALVRAASRRNPAICGTL